jgi:hypothetical protein
MGRHRLVFILSIGQVMVQDMADLTKGSVAFVSLPGKCCESA